MSKDKEVTIVRFALYVTADKVRVVEENSVKEIAFSASGILESEFVAGMLAESLARRFTEIVSAHVGGESCMKIEWTSTGITIPESGERWILIMHGDREICRIPGWEPQDKADARLIKAAPKLLQLSKWFFNIQSMGFFPTDELLRMYRETLAEVEG